MFIKSLFTRPVTITDAYERARSLHWLYVFSPIALIIVAYFLKNSVVGEGIVTMDPQTYNMLYYIAWLLVFVVALIVFLVAPRRSSPIVIATKSVATSKEVFLNELQSGQQATSGWINSIATVGFVLFLFNGNLLDFVVFTAITLLFFLLTFPRFKQWEDAARIITPQLT